MKGYRLLTSFSSLNFAAFFPLPGSGAQISIFNWRAVKASLKKAVATLLLIDTLGSPPDAFPPEPRYFKTDWVRKTCVATNSASSPWAE